LRTFSYLAAVTIVIASAIFQGRQTGRWSTPAEFRDRMARIETVPMTIDDWDGTPLTLDTRQLRVAEIQGYFLRRYRNRRDGDVVTALLVGGRPGPIAVHTPEVCYAGAGYQASDPTSRLVLGPGRGTQPDEFRVAQLSKQESVRPEHLRIFYAWSAGGAWRPSDNPRLEFAAATALYKLYVIHETNGGGDRLAEDAGAEFTRRIIPELRKALLEGP